MTIQFWGTCINVFSCPLHVACLLGNHRRVIELVDGGADVWASDADEKTPIGHVDLKAINPKTLEDDPLSVKFLANIHKIHEYLQVKMVEAAARATHVEGTEYGDIEPDGNHIQEDSCMCLIEYVSVFIQ